MFLNVQVVIRRISWPPLYHVDDVGDNFASLTVVLVRRLL